MIPFYQRQNNQIVLGQRNNPANVTEIRNPEELTSFLEYIKVSTLAILIYILLTIVINTPVSTSIIYNKKDRYKIIR